MLRVRRATSVSIEALCASFVHVWFGREVRLCVRTCMSASSGGLRLSHCAGALLHHHLLADCTASRCWVALVLVLALALAVAGYLSVTVEQYAQGMFNVSFLVENEEDLFNITVNGVVSRDNWYFSEAMGALLLLFSGLAKRPASASSRTAHVCCRRRPSSYTAGLPIYVRCPACPAACPFVCAGAITLALSVCLLCLAGMACCVSRELVWMHTTKEMRKDASL
jgi:hypothetical protein